MSVDELVSALDEAGDRWDLYRLATGGWCVVRGSGANECRSHGDTIVEALSLAVASPLLPVVPVRPRRRYVDQYEPVRQGHSKWAVHDKTSGQDVMFVRTRTLCVEAIERWIGLVNERADAWEAEWLPVLASGVEGVDYRMAES